MILLPDGASGHTHDWVANTGTHQDALDDDNGDTSYVACSANGARLIVTFADPSDVTSVNSGVAEADIDFTQTVSVGFLSSGRSTNRRNASLVNTIFQAPSLYWSETVSYDAHASSYETINGTARTTSDGLSAWTYSDLEALALRITKNGIAEVRLSYLALLVTYTPAVTGYGNDVIGVASGDISKINGIAKADISKINGV